MDSRCLRERAEHGPIACNNARQRVLRVVRIRSLRERGYVPVRIGDKQRKNRPVIINRRCSTILVINAMIKYDDGTDSFVRFIRR